MIRAYLIIWKARILRVAVISGILAMIGAAASVFQLTDERPKGMAEDLADWKLQRDPGSLVVHKEIVLPPEFDSFGRVSDFLPPPPLDPLPRVVPKLQDGGDFGSAISAFGRFVAVGAQSDDSQGQERGAVYLYENTGEEGGWQLRHRILGDAAMDVREVQPRARFGRGVALGDGVLAVMQGEVAPDLGKAEDDPEAVYVFRSDDNWKTWREVAVLKSPEGGRGHGISLAFLDRDTLLVGAPTAEPAIPGGTMGAIYIYTRDPNAPPGQCWRPSDPLRPPLTAPQNSQYGFGSALSVSGEIVAASLSCGAGVELGQSEGARGVLLYRHTNAEGSLITWEFLGQIPRPESANRSFGGTLALTGNRLAVGNAFWLDPGPTWADPERIRIPRVYVFHAPRPDAPAPDWKLEEELTADPIQRDHRYFGRDLTMGGDWIAVPSERGGAGGVYPGMVVVYRHSLTRGWELFKELVAADPYDESTFGIKTAIADNTLLITCPAHTKPHNGHGRVYLWPLSADKSPEDVSRSAAHCEASGAKWSGSPGM
ncbi:MAG: hypothetical protein R3F19_12270 [Verrucomicrobiales bacterium]